MPESKVFFADLKASPKENLPAKLIRLMDSAGLEQILKPRQLVAIKLHFGEKGNTAYVRPVFLGQIARRVREREGFPFLTDTNTLYAGTRGNSVSHLHTAVENGFAFSVVRAPLVIADGLRGASAARVSVDLDLIQTAYIGQEIVESDVLISVAHFKGHELSGFGGTIKNVGMGCASRKGKLIQHSDLSPKVKAKKCVACGECVEHCAQGAISLGEKAAEISSSQCVGCGECILICPNGAIDVQWNADIPLFQKKMVEYTYAVLKGKRDKALFINFLTNISPACDCYGHSDSPIVHDIGVAASTDPVAIDQACADLVNGQRSPESSSLPKGRDPGEDKFRALYPKIDWTIQLDYAESLGLGSRKYELVSI
jgi:hypothetical protein